MKNISYNKLISTDKAILFIFIVTGVIIYFPTLTLPYLQDDYGILNSIRIDGLNYLFHYISNISNHHYRPLPQVIFLFFYYVFLNYPIVYHFVNLSLLIIICYFLFINLKTLLGSKIKGLIISFVFLCSYHINFAFMQWMVGIYDLLSYAFFIIGFNFILKDNYKLGNLLILFALLSKESASFLFLIPYIYISIMKRGELKKYFLKTIPFLLTFIAFLLLRLIMISQSKIPATYQIGIWGVHLIKNARTYLNVLISQVCNCMGLYSLLGSNKITIYYYLFMPILIILFLKIQGNIIKNKPLFFFNLWSIINLIPVIVLKNRANYYYVMFSYAAMLAVICITIDKSKILTKLSPKKRLIPVVFYLCSFFVVSTLYSLKHFISSEGIYEYSKEIRSFKKFVINNPNYENYIVSTNNIFAFDLNNGPELWLRKKVNVFNFEYFKLDNDGDYLIVNQPLSQLDDRHENKFILNKKKSIFIKIEYDKIRVINP